MHIGVGVGVKAAPRTSLVVPAALGWDPVIKGTRTSITNDDLDASASSAGWTTAQAARGTGVTGAYYWEFLIVAYAADSGLILGLKDGTATSAAALATYLGNITKSIGQRVDVSLFSLAVGAGWSIPGQRSAALALNGTMMFACDVDNGNLWFGYAGVWASSVTPTVGASASVARMGAFSAGTVVYPAASFNTTAHKLRLVADNFVYTPPAGFTAVL